MERSFRNRAAQESGPLTESHTLPNDSRASGTGTIPAINDCVSAIGNRFVYVLRSDRDPARHYVGFTSDVANRLEHHNLGMNRHTARNRPWSIVVSLEFTSEESAIRFERYLKSGSGRAFAKRHFQ